MLAQEAVRGLSRGRALPAAQRAREARGGRRPARRHEIGTLASAVALRRHGVDVLYLGPDTPVASWAHVAVDRRAEAAVIGVPRRADAGPTREVVAALHAARPELVIAIGGPASGRGADR